MTAVILRRNLLRTAHEPSNRPRVDLVGIELREVKCHGLESRGECFSKP